MKKQLLFILLVPCALLLTRFTCNDSIVTEYPTEVSAYFWTNDESIASQRLYIDDFYSGTVPYIPDNLTGAGNTIVKEKGLMVTMKPGKYKILVMDANENKSCRGELSMKFGRNTNISSSWNNGKCKVQVVVGD